VVGHIHFRLRHSTHLYYIMDYYITYIIKKIHHCKFLIFFIMIAIRTTYSALCIKCSSYLNKKQHFYQHKYKNKKLKTFVICKRKKLQA